jgi:hypothetical protein
MDLLKKVKPIYLDDLIFYQDQLKEAENWIHEYKNKINTTKKVLLLIGSTGSGKTLIANLLLEKFNYQIIELNGSHLRTQKKLGDFLHKALGFKNVIDLFYEEQKPIGLIMDEIETLCQNNDKGGLSEFIQILKDNQKYEKNIEKNKKQKIDMNTFIFIKNPIVCTYINNNDKKVNELKNFSHTIFLKDIQVTHYEKFTNNLVNDNEIKLNDGKKIDSKIIKYLHKKCRNDIRKFILALENIHLYTQSKNIKKNIKLDEYLKIECINDTTKNDIQLDEATQLIMHKKLKYNQLDLMYYMDPFVLPYTLYQNIVPFLNATTMNSKNKILTYSKYMESLSEFDVINSYIYENNDWYDIDNYLSYYGVQIPNYEIHQQKFNIKTHNIIEFTNIHNKASQMLVNKKLISQAKQSLNKKYTNINHLILDCELLFYYFNEFRDCVLNDEFEGLYEKRLIKYMNLYKINYESLENLLKIEKINKNEDKRKKNMNVLLKEKINEFLHESLKIVN